MFSGGRQNVSWWAPLSDITASRSLESSYYTDGSTALLHCVVGPFLYDLVDSSNQFSNQRWAVEAAISTIHQALDRGLDVNGRDSAHRTPLMVACRQPAHVDVRKVIKALLSRGADANAVDIDGCTALHHATGSWETVRAGREWRFLHEHTCRYQALLNHAPDGIEPNVRNEAGRTPLVMLVESRIDPPRDEYSYHGFRCYASREDRERALIKLLRHGASVHGTVAYGRWEGGTLLHVACDNTDARMLKVLLAHGAAADVNTAIPDGRKPLDVTAGPDTRGVGGYTPLMVLAAALAEGRHARFEFIAMKELLLRAGADPGIRNTLGQTAWGLFFAKKQTYCRWVWEFYLDGLRVEE
ncbi:Uu.00g002440.m01.CDS01 [Anthostomella pinea]|uniref:Uu.00g002440.m01.CDS01 n=1 Tax=Anthostomella pinea TaxID=933095 RepID=A0AAI8VJH2_9PEZI|nr:Uu.00g002440.m01.CDS01 [Anthostomella pinea]